VRHGLALDLGREPNSLPDAPGFYLHPIQ
jgi:hypothetical protein